MIVFLFVLMDSLCVQYKISGNGGEVVRMDVLVGDETRSYFPVTIWQKQMRSQISVGHVFLLQSMLLILVILIISFLVRWFYFFVIINLA